MRDKQRFLGCSLGGAVEDALDYTEKFLMNGVFLW